MRDVILDWLYKANELTAGQEIYVPAESRNEQKELFRQFRNELRVFREIDSESASTINIGVMFKDSRFWVVLKKHATVPTVGFIKDPDTGTQRVVLSSDKERKRRIGLMLNDGLPLEEIEAIEGKLTDDERREFRV